MANITKMFERIDLARLRPINVAPFIGLAILVTACIIGSFLMITELAEAWLYWFYIMPLMVCVIFLGFIPIVLLFKVVATKKSKPADQDMARAYKEIKESRRHLRNLNNTFNKMLTLKTGRSVEERDRVFLRKLNSIGLESLRLC